MSLPPWLVLSLVTSLCLSLVYQIATRRFGWRILAYWLVIFLGIIGAEVLAESLGWNITRLGDLRVAPDLAGAALVLAVLWFMGV